MIEELEKFIEELKLHILLKNDFIPVDYVIERLDYILLNGEI